jgi:PAS domain S-box-containing protein
VGDSQIDIGVFRLNDDGNLRLDSSLFSLLGHPPDAAAGRDPLDWLRSVIHPDDLEYDLADQRDLLGGVRRQVRRELRMCGPDRDYIWVVRTAIHTDEGIVGTIEILDELRARAARHESLIANLPVGLVTYRLRSDDQLELVEANRAASELVDIDLQGGVGKTMLELFPNLRGTEYPDWFREVARNGGRRERTQSAPADRTRIPGIYDSVLFRSMPSEATMVFMDVTARVQLQERTEELRAAAERNEARFRALFDHAPLMIDSFDAGGRCLLWNRECERLLGYTRDDLDALEDPFAALYPDPKTRDAARRSIAAADGTFRECEVRTRSGNGRIQRWADIALEGEVISVGYDLTELRQTLSDLEQFAYIASHDLRSPLHAIRNLVGFIREDSRDALPEASRRHLEQIEQRIGRMERLLIDLLEYARTGRAMAPVVEVDVGELTRATVELLAIPPGFEVRTGELPTLRTYRTPLQTVLRQLIDNAVKHHDRDRGAIDISCERRGDVYQFEVADDGPGVDSEYRDKIFEVFETLRSRHEVEGTGMGLAIVKKTVERIGGRVDVRSDGRGARFRFTWPAEVEEGGVA